MIAFDLICANGHKFECWFKDGRSYDEQKAFGLISCPVCNDGHVEKAFSPVAIRKHMEKVEKRETKAEAYQVLQKIYEYIDKNFEEVGLDFTREALKIHYGEAKERNIKGQVLPDQEKVLKEEGVQFLKIPIIKRLDN